MFYDTTAFSALRIAEAHRLADLERVLRADPAAETATRITTMVGPVDTRAAGEPIAAAMPGPVTAVAAAGAECGPCRTADQAAA